MEIPVLLTWIGVSVTGRLPWAAVGDATGWHWKKVIAQGQLILLCVFQF